ncbi:MAG: YicC/YloC family endoribonuclease [Planctomycetota bacterium]
MIRSMTGYGQARQEGDGRSVVAEIRSVNGRYLKVASHVPNELAAIERDLEKLVRRRVRRGSVDLYARVEFTGARAARPINADALRAYATALLEATRELEAEVRLGVDALVALPGVLEAEELSEEDTEELAAAIAETVEAALDGLDRMRQVEGAHLREELLGHAAAIERIVAAVEAGRDEAQQRYVQRLTERVNRLLEGTDIAVGAQDLAREVAIYAERSSVAEEIARLRSHVGQFRQALDRDEPVGRRLEFLAQEMHREVNTMGSKVADVGLSEAIVDLHGSVDKIREQAANIE